MSDLPHERLAASFREQVTAGDLPDPGNVSAASVGLSKQALLRLFESQLMSRHLDYAARRFGKTGQTFYSIGSAGHEGNAALAAILRPTDMAFLHYRSGAFLIERLRQRPGSTPLWDMALSFAASAEDPVSGGRHKVLGSHALNVPPQTSTIASHLPKAVGTAYAVTLARRLRFADALLPEDAVVVANFGDASANHSTATGAINNAALAGYRGLPLPLILVCEDNGIGISVPTPDGWIAASYGNRPGLHYLRADGGNLLDVAAVTREALAIARGRRQPVFVHLSTVRLMGHAGSDLENVYRPSEEISAAEAADPLLMSAGIVLAEGLLDRRGVLELDAQLAARVDRVMRAACERPRLRSAAEVKASIIPQAKTSGVELSADFQWREGLSAVDARAAQTPQHLSRLISLTLGGILSSTANSLIFGEDVGRKGGVYGATTQLQSAFGNARIFDTVLDEQSILGLAIGLAHNGMIPIPEIQFLAYVHNAEDQIRGEAATLAFFSDGKLSNPMVIRIAGLAYQRGFGGHFHNDNALAVFRDIPGLILACPSRGDDAVRMLRGCYRLAAEQGRVVVFLEPIALYGVKDLLTDGDGGMSYRYDQIDGELQPGELGIEGVVGDADLAIVSYGNGAYLSRRALAELTESGAKIRLIDLRWLTPVDMPNLLEALSGARRCLIVDECRRSGSPSEALMTGLMEARWRGPVSRLTAEDSFIPLGPASYEVLPSQVGIVDAAKALLEQSIEA
jgi:2-oxoisovalerate dehydrogenase E1 component